MTMKMNLAHVRLRKVLDGRGRVWVSLPIVSFVAVVGETIGAFAQLHEVHVRRPPVGGAAAPRG